MSRLKEPSTAAGLGLIGLATPTLIQGIGRIVDFDEAEQVGEVAGQAIQTLATGDWMTALFVALMGGLSIWKREKANG